MRTDKRTSHKAEKKTSAGRHRQGVVGYSKKSALLEEAITHMNTGKYGRSSAALKELLALDPQNTEARRLFATLHLRLGSLVTAREAFESLANEAIGRQDYWLAESLLREYLAAGPRCIPFLELLAHVYEEKGDAMAAVAELGKAIEILLEDPDPDNSQKPSQLYTKIRELAPASPVAFQFASLFDVQTGEFRVASREPHHEPSAETQEASSITASVSTVEAIAPTEIMPWEQLDTSPSPVPASSLDKSQETFRVEETSWSSDPSHAPAIEEPKQADLVTIPETGPAIETPSFQMSGSHVLSDEPVEPPTLHDEPLPEAAPKISVETTTPVEPASVPSRMPWEHVADPALEIVEPEPPSVPVSSPDWISQSDPASSLSTTPSAERNPEPLTQNLTDETTFQHEAPASDRASPPLDSTSNPILEAPPEVSPSSPMSFTWKEIFDSAWNFTVGTTAPSSSVTAKEPVATSPPELDQPPDAAIPLPDQAYMAEASELKSVPNANPLDSTVEIVPDTTTAPSSVLPVQESTEELASVAPPSHPQEASMEAPERAESAPIAQAPVTVDPPVDEKTIPSSPQASSHWSTGEVAVQLHRPTKKKRKWEKESSETLDEPTAPSPAYEPVSEPVSDLSKGRESTGEGAPPVAVPDETSQPPMDMRPEWAKASDSIVLDQPPMPSPRWQESAEDSLYTIDEPSASPAASAVDVLFGSTGQGEAVRISDRFASAKPRPRFAVRLARLRIAITSLILSCFSTTRAFALMCVSLVVLCVVTAAAAAGVIALAWMIMEEPPTSRYQSLTNGPQRLISEHKKNGFLLLMGFDAPAGNDPIQAGYERKINEHDVPASRVCMVGHEAKGISVTGASSNVIDGWFKGADPLGQLRGQSETVKSVLAQESTSLTRYQHWLTMPFDDWGFGQILSPNCPRILLAHRLYVLEGFNQDTAAGMSRLEKDMESWRTVLGQSKTLMVKMLAATAVRDDVLVTSGLLTRPDTDAATINRLAKVVRPLDQLELSVRWPMQSHFAWATGSVTAELKKDRTEERSFHVSIAAAMPLPVQRRANAYAEYYESANRAVAEGRYVNLPKPSQFIRSSPSSVVDYLANPIEHIIGIEPLPSWEPYVNRMIETDAQLRLASLQVWVRRSPQDADVLARLAKAGQAYYDPFTGLPMLVNQSKHLLYSVGQDGKDQEGDRRLDIVVSIPFQQPSEPKRTSK